MSEKWCVTCHVTRPLSDFNRRANSSDGLQPRCRHCARAWYAANRERHKANVQARNRRVREENRQRLRGYLLEHPCVDCGERDLRVLDFDHDDPAQKVDEVVKLIGYGTAWTRVEAEIAKCSVRCANCHRRRTCEEFGYWRHEAELARQAEQRNQAAARLSGLHLT